VSLLAALLLLAATSPASATAPRNIRGIHTLARESSEEIERQLTWALPIVGPGGYVTQPFSSVGRDSDGPSMAAVEFVEQAYARELYPIVRLQGAHASATGCNPLPYSGWLAPEADDDGELLSYLAEAEGYKRFVEGLPRLENRPLYVQIGNEPNLRFMWGGQADPREYARFFVDVSRAIRAIGDPRIKLLNAGLAPEGDIDNLEFIRAVVEAEPKFNGSFDYWASHTYPHNLPPGVNFHDGTAPPGSRYAIDSYLLELEVLASAGVEVTALEVILTETGYRLGDQHFASYPAIDVDSRAEYMRQAFSHFWPRWPELRAVTPFQLADPHGTWSAYDWVSTASGTDPYGFPSQPDLQYALQVPSAGVVRGRVVDPVGNELSGVRVMTDRNGHLAETRADGGFVLMVLPGAYALRLEKVGYESSTLSVETDSQRVAEVRPTLAERLPRRLQNGSFELGTLEPWTSWGSLDGVQNGPWFLDSGPHEGPAFLGTAVNCGEKDGGVYQSIAVSRGASVVLEAWTLTARRGTAPVRTRVGIDPTGGTDPTRAEIEWTEWLETEGVWLPASSTITAQADRVTVFLQHDQDAANAWNLTAFDQVRLRTNEPDAGD
jgi:hypothetical protein